MKHNIIKEIIQGVLQGIGIGAIIWCTTLYFTGDNKLNDIRNTIVSLVEKTHFVGCMEGLEAELNMDKRLSVRICKPLSLKHSKLFKEFMEK